MYLILFDLVMMRNVGPWARPAVLFRRGGFAISLCITISNTATI